MKQALWLRVDTGTSSKTPNGLCMMLVTLGGMAWVPTSHHWPLSGSAPGSRAGGRAQPPGGPRGHVGEGPQSQTCSPARAGVRPCSSAEGSGWCGGAGDSLKGLEGLVFFHCHRDGLGALVVEEVGCQAGRRGTGVSEQELPGRGVPDLLTQESSSPPP